MIYYAMVEARLNLFAQSAQLLLRIFSLSLVSHCLTLFFSLFSSKQSLFSVAFSLLLLLYTKQVFFSLKNCKTVFWLSLPKFWQLVDSRPTLVSGLFTLDAGAEMMLRSWICPNQQTFLIIASLKLSVAILFFYSFLLFCLNKKNKIKKI